MAELAVVHGAGWKREAARPPLYITAAPRRPRVLVAEQDRELRRMVARMLGRAGCEVLLARDGLGLLDRVESTVFDVIVTAAELPGLRQLGVLPTLRCTTWTTPVILLAALGDPASMAEAADLGALLLRKPLDLDALRVAVNRLLAYR